MGGMGESVLLPKGKNLLSAFEHLFPSSPLSLFFPVLVCGFFAHFSRQCGEVKLRDMPQATQGGCSPAQFGTGRCEEQPDGAGY